MSTCVRAWQATEEQCHPQKVVHYMQATMVGTWLLELYLDQLNRSLLEVKGQPTAPDANGHTPRAAEEANGGLKAPTAPDQLTQDLRTFLKRNVNVLDVNVTVSLLAGYGCLDDLMEYATYRKVGHMPSMKLDSSPDAAFAAAFASAAFALLLLA